MIDQPAIVIQNDRGGLVGDYLAQLWQAKKIHARVEIRGDCFSTCTLWTSMPDVCVGPEAKLGFHSTNIPAMNVVLMAYYPAPIKAWLDKRQGLNPNIKFLAGQKLHAMFKECPE